MKIVFDFSFFQKLIWFLQDRCGECGGELYIKMNYKAICKKCGAKN